MSSCRWLFQSIVDWIDDYGPNVAVATCGTLFGLFGLFASDEVQSLFHFQEWKRYVTAIGFWGAAVFLFLGIASVVWQCKHQRRITELGKEIVKLQDKCDKLEAERLLIAENYRNIIEGYLFRFATGRLEFGTKKENTERVTLYLHDPAGHFVSIGRYSSNPLYKNPGKAKHSTKHGCLGAAWKDGWCFENGFCDPSKDRNGYISKHGKYGLTKSIARNYAMKSRLYCGCRIDSRNGQKPIAVIIIESTDPVRFSEECLQSVLRCEEVRYIADLVEGVIEYVGMPGEIAKMGF